MSEQYEPTDTVCLRCGEHVSMRFAGTCEQCTAELHAKFDGASRDVTAPAYEPTAHVTPNAVALKDD